MLSQEIHEPIVTAPPELLTTPEVAVLLRITPRHVRNLTKEGTLRAIHLGRTVRFLRRSIMDSLMKLELAEAGI